MINILDAASLSQRDRNEVVLAVKRVFGVPVMFTKNQIDIQQAYDNSRRQYNSTALLAQLLTLNLTPCDKIIAVADVDLFIPILTFVFGEAQLDGSAAVVSTHRLSNQFYGIEEDTILKRERLEKEIVHELGHTFGLYHCHQFECVMRSSTYVEEIDLKRVGMCEGCKELLGRKIGEVNLHPF